ncbi:MAG: NAD(P)-binding domain-containing protein [Butyrivibrio sp.]|nr:NAD(P)-binding domain-containing protein [Butyrivibrio sp.]
MRVKLCQDDPFGGAPSRAEIISFWRKQLEGIPAITSVDIEENFTPDRADEIAADYDILLGAWIADDLFDRAFFERHPNLKYIATFGHGFGKFDHQAARDCGVTITNTVYGDMTIAQFAMALLLGICHHVETESSYYNKILDKNMSFRAVPGVTTRQIELYEKTIGIIGLGSIGLWMARMASGFGMKVIAYSRHKREGEKYSFVEQVSLEELLRRSDVISIHCPLTDDTRGMISAQAISRMKDGVILINTARGAIIDETAMVDALKSGKIYAAGLDVVTGEPRHDRSPVFDCPNALITGHIAWAPAEARYRTVRIAVQNMRNWLAGNPTSVI